MSTLKSSAEHLTLNADGSGNDIKFQSNATEVAAIDQAGNLTLSGTVDGVDIAARDAILTSTTTTAGAALPKAGGAMTGILAGFTSTGIDDNATSNAITIDASENVGIGTNSPSVPLHVKKTGSTSAVQEFIRSENHALGGTGAGSSMNFHHYHGGGGPAGGAKAASITAVNSGSWAGGTPSSYSTALTFGTIHENTFDERLRIDSSGQVGIGTTTPNTKLVIINNTDTDYGISSGATNYGLSIVNTTSGANNSAGILLGTESNGEIYLSAVQNSGNSASDFRIATRHSGSRSDKFIVSSAGYVTKPLQPCFHVAFTNNGHTTSSATNLVYDQVFFNVGSNYSTSTGRFTAPIAGKYVFSQQALAASGTATNSWMSIDKNGTQASTKYLTHTNHSSHDHTIILSLAVNDYVQVHLGQGVIHTDSTHQKYTYFEGYLLQ